ncbi:hypothetical protein DM860_005505 [Cuscuta australis]|uniref:Uncharacterized protein n=1 Tax=Cuscuta australis TaxID=267555 RepID=A0A328E3E8_9ASTE|nr:hypothetical protein DM860_005505 [Cuscuta australis]
MATLDSDINMVPADKESTGGDPSSSVASASSSTKKVKKFEIKKWNAVALWAWGTISWIFVSSVKLIKPVPQVRSVQLLGGFATMHSTSTALAVGSRLVKCAPWVGLLHRILNRMSYPPSGPYFNLKDNIDFEIEFGRLRE